ncbi:hypothetical protein ACFQBQ_06135 [Granulicella cerasi]|uniref:DUF5666 domain-containing protein n=1 Tax=Granulicella cerasi TaxID=741063 RepID=A0ABW1Z9G3_9BACT|nr:hypothetical protein [Granulicella cerasi]
MIRFRSAILATAVALGPISLGSVAFAQVAPAAAATSLKVTGTVKSVGAGSLVITSANGDVALTLPDAAKILLVAPGSKDLKSAIPGAATDISVGDRALVTATPEAAPATPSVLRVIVMKSAAIETAHAAEEAAWTQGIGGIVKSVDPTTGKLMVASGQKMIAVSTTPSTIVRRYSGGSVRFADATVSTLGSIGVGDQIRVRGTKSPDGTALTADEMVAGTFRNFSGLVTAIDPATGAVTLKDLASKKVVKVEVTKDSDVRRLPPQMAQMIAMRLKGQASAGAPSGAAAAGSPAAGGRPAGGWNGGGEGGDARARSQREGSGLSSIMQRLPTETLSGLKTGEAVMIVATQSSADSTTPSAVTMLVGVDAILTAPSGDTMTLSPWGLGGSSGAEAAGGVQ